MRDLQCATYVPMQKWWLLISIYLIVNQRNEPHHEKEHVKIQPSFRAVGQKLVEWQIFEKSKNKRHLLTVIPPKPYFHASVVTYLWTPLLTSTLNWSVCDFHPCGNKWLPDSINLRLFSGNLYLLSL